MKNNEMWMVSVDNVYSFDNIEKRSFLTLDEKEAKSYFKEMVKEYIKYELETASDLFDRKFLSLTEIIDHIKEKKKDKESLYLNSTEIKSIEYNYGLDVNKEKTCALFTVGKYTEEIFGNESSSTKSFEEYYIMLRKVKLGEEITECGVPILNNVEEIESILESL